MSWQESNTDWSNWVLKQKLGETINNLNVLPPEMKTLIKDFIDWNEELIIDALGDLWKDLDWINQERQDSYRKFKWAQAKLKEEKERLKEQERLDNINEVL